MSFFLLHLENDQQKKWEDFHHFHENMRQTAENFRQTTDQLSVVSQTIKTADQCIKKMGERDQQRVFKQPANIAPRLQ